MPFAYEKLPRLDRDRLIGVVDPVLSQHGVEGVELIWKKDSGSWVLYVTVERSEQNAPENRAGVAPLNAEPATADPAAAPTGPDGGSGMTLDDCSRLSRAISAALDEADLIQTAYRLEVGTPGIERRLYSLQDFRRFSGKLARIKPGRRGLLVGRLQGVDEREQVLLETGDGEVALEFPSIESARLEIDPSLYGVAQSNNDPASRVDAK